MRLASYVPGELIPLPLSGSIPELPHVAKVGRSRLQSLAMSFSRPLVFVLPYVGCGAGGYLCEASGLQRGWGTVEELGQPP